jgi:hypothetical protein
MFDFGSLPWGDIAKAGFQLFGSMQGSDAAKKAGQQATPRPYGVLGPAGGMGVDPRTGQLMLSMANNPFAQMFNAMAGPAFANAATAPGSFLHGANPELAAAYQGTFGQGLTQGIQGNLNLLRQAAAPQEQQAFNQFQDSIFAKTGGSTSGDTERLGRFQESMNAADLNRQIQAIGLGRQEASDRFQNAFTAIGQGMNNQNQQFNLGMGAFGGMQGLFGNLINQSNLGIGAMSGMPPELAMYQAQMSQQPYMTGYNLLNQSGIFDRLNGLFQPKPSGGGQPPGYFDPSIYG